MISCFIQAKPFFPTFPLMRHYVRILAGHFPFDAFFTNPCPLGQSGAKTVGFTPFLATLHRGCL
jgi:hypothetical protein